MLPVPVGSSAPNGVDGQYDCTGGQTWEDISSYFYGNWSTANTSIATVDSGGNHTGQSVGITNATTWGDVQSFDMQYHCPIQQKGPQGADNVWQGVLTPSDNFPERSKTDFGIAETIKLVLLIRRIGGSSGRTAVEHCQWWRQSNRGRYRWKRLICSTWEPSNGRTTASDCFRSVAGAA